MSHVRPLDACVIVRDLFASIQALGISPTPPVRLDGLLVPAIARRMCSNGSFRIKLSPRYWSSQFLRAMLLRYSDRAEIVYSMDLNTCWRRFVICKELAHLLIDTDAKHFTRDPVALVQELLNDVPVIAPEHDVNSERLATIAAIEMLLPWCLRQKLNDMANEGNSDLQLAEHFRVPENVINVMVRSHFGDLSRQMNAFNESGGGAEGI